MLVYARIVKLVKWERLALKVKNYQSEDILKIVHTNFCGPIGVESYTRENFFILFVDDYFRMMTVMYLREKLEAFEKFK